LRTQKVRSDRSPHKIKLKVRSIILTYHTAAGSHTGTILNRPARNFLLCAYVCNKYPILFLGFFFSETDRSFLLNTHNVLEIIYNHVCFTCRPTGFCLCFQCPHGRPLCYPSLYQQQRHVCQGRTSRGHSCRLRSSQPRYGMVPRHSNA
jgi:hypothetical protein